MKGWAVGFAVVLLATGLGWHSLRAPADVEVDVAPQSASMPGRLFLPSVAVRPAADAGVVPLDTRSILKIPAKMRYGDFVWNDVGVRPGEIEMMVDLRRQLISVFRSGHEIGSAVILYGGDGHETPVGTYPVLTKSRDYRSITYDAPMPFSLRLTNDGVAIHGSDVRWGAATHGCIGVPLEFARLLFGEAKVGDPVRIVRSPDRPAHESQA